MSVLHNEDNGRFADDVDGYLFCTARRKTGQLTANPLFQQDAHRIIRRRAKAAGIETRIGNHTFRATGITAYLKNSGKLEVAQQIANHESPRTTKLYDRRQDEISLERDRAHRDLNTNPVLIGGVELGSCGYRSPQRIGRDCPNR